MAEMTDGKTNGGYPADSRVLPEIYDWIESIVFSVAALILIFTLLFRPVGVCGVSMENTFNAGVTNENTCLDRVLIVSYWGRTPKREDIVVLSTKAVDQPIIKRVIAVGGDRVDIDFDRHTVSVNGAILSEPYIREPTSLRGDVTFPVEVPKGYVFVMGDNRNDSHDSRFSDVGMVDERDLLGKAFLRIYPFNEMKIIASPFS